MTRGEHVAAALVPSRLVLDDAGENGDRRDAHRLVEMRPSMTSSCRYYVAMPSETGGELGAPSCGVMEMQRWKARNTSWLFTSTSGAAEGVQDQRGSASRVGDYLEQDGSLFMLTPVDALFALLPALEAAQADGYQSVEQIIELVPCDARLGHTEAFGDQLRCACDIKLAAGREFFRLNDAKAVAWLDCKLHKLVSYMRIHAEEGVRALDEDGLTLYCINILGEWAGTAWTSWLKRLHKVEDPVMERNVNAVPEANPDVNVGKSDADAKTDLSRKKKVEEGRRKSNIEKNAKAAKGTKSLLSFFGGSAKARVPQ